MKIRKIKGIEYVYDGDKCLGRKDKLPVVVDLKNEVEAAYDDWLAKNPKAAAAGIAKNNDIDEFVACGELLQDMFLHQMEHYINEEMADVASVLLFDCDKGDVSGIIAFYQNILMRMKKFIEVKGVSSCVVDRMQTIIHEAQLGHREGGKLVFDMAAQNEIQIHKRK